MAERKKKTSTTDDHKIKTTDLSSLHQQETMSSLADNCPYRGDLDNNPNLYVIVFKTTSQQEINMPFIISDRLKTAWTMFVVHGKHLVVSNLTEPLQLIGFIGLKSLNKSL